MKAVVYVTLKPGVLDPAGKAVMNGLHALGYDEVGDVRIGKYFEMEIEGELDQARIEEMCNRLLANTVIEDFRVEVQP